ncbi:UNVERIFIED_CONTAM: hypothetical protein Slati_4596600 [Sesamum latifolium]|uniref:Uncharacterized protein n=3 Tax=Pentapetalae TaxID=1437201 RepID=A0AAW2S390_9LAMI
MCLHSNVIIGMNAVKVGEKRRDGRRRPRPHAQTAGSGRERARANPCRPACAQAHGSRRPGGRQTAAVAQPAVPCRRACTGGRRQGRARASGSRSCARIAEPCRRARARIDRPLADLRARASTDPWPTCARLDPCRRARIRQSVVRAHRPNPADVRARLAEPCRRPRAPLPSPADARARLAEPCRRALPTRARAWPTTADVRARAWPSPADARAWRRRARARLCDAAWPTADARASLAGNCRRARASLADHCRRARAPGPMGARETGRPLPTRARAWTTTADARARAWPGTADVRARAWPTTADVRARQGRWARARLADHCRRARAPGPARARWPTTADARARAWPGTADVRARAWADGRAREPGRPLPTSARAWADGRARDWPTTADVRARAWPTPADVRAAGPTDALETGRPQATCARSWADGRARGWPTPAEVLAQLGRRARARLADPCRRARAPGRPLPTRARAWPTTADARASLAGHCRRARASLADHCDVRGRLGRWRARDWPTTADVRARAWATPANVRARAWASPADGRARAWPTPADEAGRPQPTCARSWADGRARGRPLPTCARAWAVGRARDWPTSADVRARACRPLPTCARAPGRRQATSGRLAAVRRLFAADVRSGRTKFSGTGQRPVTTSAGLGRQRSWTAAVGLGVRHVRGRVMDDGRGPSRATATGAAHQGRAPRTAESPTGGQAHAFGLSMSHARHHLFYAAVGLARPLCRLQYPVAYLSRLQRILPAARWELYFKAANAARPPRGLGQRHVPLGARGPLLRVGKRTAGVRVASSPDSDLEAFSHNPAHGSFAPLAFQPSAMTNCANQRFLSY